MTVNFSVEGDQNSDYKHMFGSYWEFEDKLSTLRSENNTIIKKSQEFR